MGHFSEILESASDNHEEYSFYICHKEGRYAECISNVRMSYDEMAII